LVKKIENPPIETTKALKPLKYKLGPNDLDLRGQSIKFHDALEMAFQKTGLKREDFTVTKWQRTKDGKSIPVEYRTKDGAEVNLDFAHDNAGQSPDAPHIGWQKGKGKQKQLGHILLDEVPAWRSNDKSDFYQR
jgi:Bacterial toxin 47